MLRTLSIRNGFVHQNLNVTFHEGQTAIVGKNGKGKSLITEFAQYALWGTKALRGDAQDYKKLQVSASFDVKGKSYAIHRSASSVNLIGPDGPLASGTKAVNLKIESLFGYDYNVFMVANAANQGEIAKLSAMGGADRKRMVDKTIGLDVLDNLEKFIADNARTLRGRMDGLRSAMVAPVAPEPPENYGPTEGLQARIDKLREDDRQADILHAKANALIAWPEAYTSDGHGVGLVHYQNMQEAFIEDRATRKALAQELSRLPAPLAEAKLHPYDPDLATLEASQKRRTELLGGIKHLEGFLKGIPRTTEYTSAQLTAMMDQWDLRIRWVSRNKLREQLVTYHCPNCDHEWHDEDPRLADYSDVPEEVEEPKISYREVVRLEGIAKQSEQMKVQFEARDQMFEEASKILDQSATIQDIYTARKRHDAYVQSLGGVQRRAEIEDLLAQPEAPDYSTQIKAAELDLKKIEDFERETKRCNQQREEQMDAREKLMAFPETLKRDIVFLQDQLTASTAFDSLLMTYHGAYAKFREQNEQLSEMDFELDNWVLAREALKDTRSTIKMHLVPSLNKVASHLINQMTGGDLSSIVVDEDFEDITVNGLKLHKLSGSGKDVANLALRLGLGMVLTNRTFSSLWLDEIDAGCDDDRAAYISQCLHNLTSTFKQIIVISHKPTIVSDQRIEL